MRTPYLVAGVRTPFGRYGGALATRPPGRPGRPRDGRADRRLPSVDWAAVDDVVLGCANQAGEDNRNVARMAVLLAGLPVDVPGTTVNRLCGSGLDAVAIAARAVRSGEADLVIAGGVESMTRAPIVLPKAGTAWSRTAEVYDTTIGWRFVNPVMRERYGTHAMPETAENVAERHGIARADQDLFALRSQERTAKAIAGGRLAREIEPVPVPQRKGDPVPVERRRAPARHLAGGAGSPAAAVPGRHRHRRQLVGHQRRRRRGAGGLRGGRAPLRPGAARPDRAAPSPGCRRGVMGIGPVPATRKVLARAGLDVADMDVIELNEAFAAQALAVTRALGPARRRRARQPERRRDRAGPPAGRQRAPGSP